MSALKVALASAFVLSLLSACHDGRTQTPVPATTIRDALTQLARGEADLAPLTVTFDHLHALHGGLQLTIRGDGTIQQKSLRTKAGEPKPRWTVENRPLIDTAKLSALMRRTGRLE